MSLNTTRRTHYPPVDRVTRLDQRTRPTRHRHSHQDEDDMGVVETLQLRSGRKRHHDRDHAASPRRHAGAAGGGGASGRARRAARPSQHEHERQSFPTLSNGPDTSKGPVSYASVKSHHDVPDGECGTAEQSAVVETILTGFDFRRTHCPSQPFHQKIHQTCMFTLNDMHP